MQIGVGGAERLALVLGRNACGLTSLVPALEYRFGDIGVSLVLEPARVKRAGPQHGSRPVLAVAITLGHLSMVCEQGTEPDSRNER